MIVRDATYSDLLRVVDLMRTADAHEVFAGRFDETRSGLASDLHAAKPYHFAQLALCGDNGNAIGIIGGRLMWPGVAAILMIATDEWPQIARAATRWVQRVALPKIVDPVAHRSQCEAWEGNLVTLRWLSHLGYVVEGRLEAYGKNREGFLQYARLRPEQGWPPNSG